MIVSVSNRFRQFISQTASKPDIENTDPIEAGTDHEPYTESFLVQKTKSQWGNENRPAERKTLQNK